MIEGHINLYSDTQTRPTPAMRQAMFEAPVGDEQHGLDPTVNRLCERVAELVGKEAAVFLPSGTMCNEIAVLVHCRPGDEVYAERSAHLIHFEAGGPAALAGAQLYPLEGERGIYTAETLHQAIRIHDRYGPRPRLAVVEQTANLGGGTVWPLEAIHRVAEVARSRGLALHMDGARLLNAAVAAGVSPQQFAAPFDSVWVDLSKGLGCPVGAVLAGSRDFVDEAWRWKQRMGGAMRQAGFLAAAGLYALAHHVERLAEDHENARRFGEIVSSVEGVCLPSGAVETNIVFVEVSGAGITAGPVSALLEEQGINIGVHGETLLRAVTHLDVNRAQVEEAGRAFVAVVEQLRGQVTGPA
jgi:threonine aldolase